MEHLKKVINNGEEIIYVSDIDNYELVFVNDKFKQFWGTDVIGKKCYKVLQGLDNPCPFCTNHLITDEKFGETYIWEFKNQTTGKWFKCFDKAIEWEKNRICRIEYAYEISREKELEFSLKERMKEISCIYKITKWTNDDNLSLNQLISNILKTIKLSFQFPEFVSVRINYLDKEYTSDGFLESTGRISSDIYNKSNILGKIEVFNSKRNSEADNYFLAEEQELLDAVSGEISKYYQKRKAQKEIEDYKSNLENRVAKLTNDVLELSLPVLPIDSKVLLMPLIGQLEHERAALMMDKLLNAVYQFKSQVVIIDLTGVPSIDTQAAQNIINVIMAAKLLGVKIILTGIKPDIAQTMIHLGIDIENVEKCSVLSEGLKKALYTIKNREK